MIANNDTAKKLAPLFVYFYDSLSRKANGDKFPTGDTKCNLISRLKDKSFSIHTPQWTFKGVEKKQNTSYALSGNEIPYSTMHPVDGYFKKAKK